MVESENRQEWVETLQGMFPKHSLRALENVCSTCQSFDQSLDLLLADVMSDNESDVQEVGPSKAQAMTPLNQRKTALESLPFFKDDDVQVIEPNAQETKDSEDIVDMRKRMIAQVESIFPDCDPAYIAEKMDEQGAYTEQEFQIVVDKMLENRDYPKRGIKRAASPSNRQGKKRAFALDEIDDTFVPDADYTTQSVRLLASEFVSVSSATIHQVLNANNHQYALAQLSLKNRNLLPELKNPRKPQVFQITHDRLKREKEWLENRDKPRPPPTPSSSQREEKGEFECQCCYEDGISASKITACEDGTHFFCFDCANRQVAEMIGKRQAKIPCMSSENCKYSFPPHEIRRFLDPKTALGWEKLVQEVDLKEAMVDGFESCPFCDYGAILTTDKNQDKLFHCENDLCRRVSCRLCQKENHLPLTCEEADKDNILGKQHQIEEAMTKALLRTCPKCGKAFLKEEGCNKITCSCGMYSCYVCGKDITKEKYNHFHQGPGGRSNPGKTCPLWEDSAKRLADEVNRAREQAMAELRQEAPNILGEIKVDEIKAPVRPQNVPPHLAHLPQFFQGLGHRVQPAPREIPAPFDLLPVLQERAQLDLHIGRLRVAIQNFQPGTKKARRRQQPRNQFRLQQAERILRQFDEIIQQHPQLVDNYANRARLQPHAQLRAYNLHFHLTQSWNNSRHNSEAERRNPLPQ